MKTRRYATPAVKGLNNQYCEWYSIFRFRRYEAEIFVYKPCRPKVVFFFNPLSPYDALKHHFKSLKTHLIFLQLGVSEWKFQWNWFTNTWQFSSIFHQHQIIFIHYKSRIATEILDL